MDYTLNIKVALVRKGKTQEDIARALGMTRARFNRKLNKKGNHCFTIDEAYELSKALNTPFDEIFLNNDVA